MERVGDVEVVLCRISLASLIDSVVDDIEKLQDKLTAMQDKYYDQFSKMEVAMSKVNATASQLGFQPTSGNQY